MKILLITIFFSFSTFNVVKAQGQWHESHIRKAIDNYLKGYINNDRAPLLASFDIQHGHLKGVKKITGINKETRGKFAKKDSVTGEEEPATMGVVSKDSVFVIDFAALIERWANKKPFTDAQKRKSNYKILQMDVIDEKLATAKIQIQLGDNLYIDYLSLYNINGTWKFINKVFIEGKGDSDAANQTHEASIKNALDNYLYGYLDHDRKRLLQSFDTQYGHMKWVVKDKTGKDQVKVLDFAHLIDEWLKHTPFTEAQKNKSSYKILQMDILGQKLAYVKLQTQFDNSIFIDCFTLYNINGTWKFVNKVFVEKK